MPKISIITSVFNAASYIEDCIESVISQAQQVEYIIIDGGSTDGTLEIIRKYDPKLAKVVSEPDTGMYDGMNKGLKLATGDIIGILNADDIYAGSKILSKVVATITGNNTDSCYGDLVYVEQSNINRVVRYWQAGDYNLRRFYHGWMPPHPTFFIRRKFLEKHGLFNLNLGSAADYELMLRYLLKYEITTSYIPEVLVKMRAGGLSNRSLINRFLANRNDRLAWKVNGLKPHFWTLYLKPLSKIGQYLPRKIEESKG